MLKEKLLSEKDAELGEVREELREAGQLTDNKGEQLAKIEQQLQQLQQTNQQLESTNRLVVDYWNVFFYRIDSLPTSSLSRLKLASTQAYSMVRFRSF